MGGGDAADLHSMQAAAGMRQWQEVGDASIHNPVEAYHHPH